MVKGCSPLLPTPFLPHQLRRGNHGARQFESAEMRSSHGTHPAEARMARTENEGRTNTHENIHRKEGGRGTITEQVWAMRTLPGPVKGK